MVAYGAFDFGEIGAVVEYPHIFCQRIANYKTLPRINTVPCCGVGRRFEPDFVECRNRLARVLDSHSLLLGSLKTFAVIPQSAAIGESFMRKQKKRRDENLAQRRPEASVAVRRGEHHHLGSFR